jgi:SAM-dependent methyltransferase
MNETGTTLEAPSVSYLERYRAGVWRDRIFFDMIVDDVQPAGRDLAVLDIGCGRGFDGDVPLQQEMARLAGRFIGVEPDRSIPPSPIFHEVHRCLFEDAPIAPGSIDLAYAIMVLEHLAEPQSFFDKLHEVLKPGGVFWGLTVDCRHWFCTASKWFDRLRLKNWYLNRLLGKRGEARYENYPVHYRCNRPDDVERHAREFSSVQCWNLSRVGQCSAYFPRVLVPMAEWLDRHGLRKNRPGTLLVTRVRR